MPEWHLNWSVRMKIFRRAFKDTLPVLTGYLVLGLGFGILLNSKGYNALIFITGIYHERDNLLGHGAVRVHNFFDQRREPR